MPVCQIKIRNMDSKGCQIKMWRVNTAVGVGKTKGQDPNLQGQTFPQPVGKRARVSREKGDTYLFVSHLWRH